MTPTSRRRTKDRSGSRPGSGSGSAGIKPYNSTVYCGQTDVTAANGNAPLCTGRTPFRIDLEAAYGVAKHVELLFELRLGARSETSARHPGPKGRARCMSRRARGFSSVKASTRSCS